MKGGTKKYGILCVIIIMLVLTPNAFFTSSRPTKSLNLENDMDIYLSQVDDGLGLLYRMRKKVVA